jgi:phosphoenolpyruvate carboxykinase (GTP)
MAMLPFCGYNMGDYFAHWLEMGKNTEASKLPKIFYVNWFRKDADGGWLWPGFGENSRVLKWIVERVSGKGETVETPIGYLPASGAIDTSGLNVTDDQMGELLNVDVEEWLNEIESIREHYARFEETLPEALSDELAALEARLREKQ